MLSPAVSDAAFALCRSFISYMVEQMKQAASLIPNLASFSFHCSHHMTSSPWEKKSREEQHLIKGYLSLHIHKEPN